MSHSPEFLKIVDDAKTRVKQTYVAAVLARVLQKMGYTNVISMDGGWRDWVAAGGPVEK